MFRNFSFEAASRHPSDLELERAYMNVSPTSSPWPLPYISEPPAVTIGELSQRFSQHTLEVDPNYNPNYEPTSYFDAPTSTKPYAHDVDSAYSSRRPSYAQASYNGLSPAAIRLQRQANVRLQCNTSHVKDISSLVERMMDKGEQCRICTRPRSNAGLSATSSDEEEDTGIESRRSSAATLALKYRRSGERLGGQACVSKSVRLRKKKSRKSLPAKA
ncbi:uncharacterized protein BDZ99DRAFT_460299 [Mytilinidion resinicola]|uniref:Uncharacterized protein n=1 Tax=Mytilinidion resinicola TaxID=574789 RepID=A0A6A6YVY8_9PEZI|nr:uncharacterized protein BDZ99DRAFT_460299 [Mytilinidion resinicola]KAF2812971.1 hypothetical protein BDZ99DRAFT_460299 [Mytilinidion resinicola]